MKQVFVLGAVGAAMLAPLSLRASDNGTDTTNQASPADAGNAIEVDFTSNELENWTMHDNKAKDFSSTIVSNADGDKSALQLQYIVETAKTAKPSEVPDSMGISSSALASRLTFTPDKPVFCNLRIKASQQRTIRIYLCDSTGQNFFTGQTMINTDWQTIEVPISQGFWNKWYSPNSTHGDAHDQVVWPLKDFRVDLLFAQSVPHFAPAGGPSVNVPEQIQIEWIRFHQ